MSLLPAFPSHLHSTVAHLSPLLAPGNDLSPAPAFSVTCEGQSLQIPVRIYTPPISEPEFAALPTLEKSIAACWFTRHHNGQVRERFLRTLSAFDSPCIVAYVVALCGEYVLELLDYIWAQHTRFAPAVLSPWLIENSAFYARTRRRIVSYWDCYYRSSFPRFETYVGSRLIDFFEEAQKSHAQ
jgi:hypothetical protein